MAQQAPNPLIPSLTTSPINLASIRDYTRREFIECLETVRGRKALVLDPSLSGPLGLVTEKSVLKEHGVEKTHHLLPDVLNTDERAVIYVVRAKIPLMKMIANQIKAHLDSKQQKEYAVFLVPRKTLVCERVLEEEGVLDYMNLDEFHMDLIPFEDDVLSLEMSDSFRECTVDNDKTSLYHVAKSIMKLQSLFGIIPNIRGKGNSARAVCDMLLRMRRELGADEANIESEIDQLILIDREVDMVTPMMTQLTYEGLIDEHFHVLNGIVDLDPRLVPSQGSSAPAPGAPTAPKKIKVPLNSNDRVFADLRDRNFAAVGPALKKRALQLQEVQQERHTIGEEVSKIRGYVAKLKEMNLQQEKAWLGLHTNLASDIGVIVRDGGFNRRLEAEQCMLQGRDGRVNDFIDEAIFKQDDLSATLRLLCLQSLTNNGLKRYADYRRELLHTYGFDLIFTLNNLEKIGIFKKQEGRASWPNIKRALQLLVEDVDEMNPRDMSYVFSGYAPLSTRIVQFATKPPAGGWRGLEENLRSLPGPLFEELQAPASVANPGAAPPTRGGDGAGGGRARVTLVYFIGGVTFTEISAIRFLQKQEEGQRDFVICTTKLITGNSLMESLIDRVARKPSAPAAPASATARR